MLEALEWTFLRQEHLSQDLKEVREPATEGKVFQEAGTAKCKGPKAGMRGHVSRKQARGS